MTLQEKCEYISENLETSAVINLLMQLGADRYDEKEDYVIFPTICHNEDASSASMKLYYYKDNKFFYCYTDEGGMSIFTFLKHYYETRGIEYDWYENIFRVAENCSIDEDFDYEAATKFEKKSERYRKREVVQLPEYSKGVLDLFQKFYTPEWLNDGISKEAMDKFNILYCPTRNKIIIPHFDIDGRLIGIRGRALNEIEIELGGKYMPIEVEKT